MTGLKDCKNCKKNVSLSSDVHAPSPSIYGRRTKWRKTINEMVGNIPGGNFLGGNFPGGSFPGGSLMGGNFPGGNFPRTTEM